MLIIGTVTQSLLYLCLAVLMGSFITAIIPTNYRPGINIPKKIVLLALLGVVLCSFVPIFQLIMHLSPLLGVTQSIYSVLFAFETGKSWSFSFVIAILFVLFLFFYEDKRSMYYTSIGVLLTLLLIGAQGWSSHVSSYAPFIGFITDTAHLTAVSIWVGILIVLGWFTTNQSNWLALLKWFTPMAIACLVTTIITGLIMMNFVVDFENYYNSWSIPYGQSLLIKHILIIPLLVYAFINGILVKKKLQKDDTFNPRPWTKTESIVLFLIFTATAALGQQSPPKETELTSENVSKMFTVFYKGEVISGLQVNMPFISILFVVLAILFLILIVQSFWKKRHVLISLCMCLLATLSLYLALMFGIQ